MIVTTTRSVEIGPDTGLADLRRLLRVSGREIERSRKLPRGVVSAVERGRLYPYPRFRRAVASFFAEELDLDPDAIEEQLFGSAKRSWSDRDDRA